MRYEEVVVSTHAVFTKNGNALYGAGSSAETFLKKNKIAYKIFKFPIVGNFYPIKGVNTSSLYVESNIEKKIPSFLPIKSIVEFYILFTLLRNTRVNVFIGVDPLNALYGLIFKKLGKINKVIFYSADYATDRFSDKLLNYFYHLIDRNAAARSDFVWNVSQRIIEIRKKQNVDSKKNILIPNSAEFKLNRILPISKINRHQLILVSSSPTSTNLPLVLNSMKILKKYYKDINLIVVGTTDWRESFEKIISKNKSNSVVKLYYNLSHEKLLELISRAGVGLALYTSQSSWTYFSDPMKVRDYLVCGLPVVSSNAIGTALEIENEKLGYVIEMHEKNLVRVISELFNNDSLYLEMRNNAIKSAKKNDINKILNKNLLSLLK